MVVQLGEALSQRGHEPLLVTRRNGVGWLPRQFAERGLPLELHSYRHFVDPRSTLELVEMLRRHRLDVLHSHEFTFALYGHLATRLWRLPHIVTLHGGTYFGQRWRRRWALRQVIGGSRATVAVSGATRKVIADIVHVPESVLHVIPNGVGFVPGERQPVRSEVELQPGELLIAAVGNLYPVKGHRTLVDALALLHAREPGLGWRAVIAGRGKEEPVLRQLAESGGIGDRVRLLGYRSDVANVFAAADMLVMPSLSEGLPLALVEAMMAGLPIVASEVGGIPEVVTHERDALLVPPGDPHALATALSRLLRDPELRSRLSTRARERAHAEYTLDGMCDRYLELYRLPAASTARASRGGRRG